MARPCNRNVSSGLVNISEVCVRPFTCYCVSWSSWFELSVPVLNNYQTINYLLDSCDVLKTRCFRYLLGARIATQRIDTLQPSRLTPRSSSLLFLQHLNCFDNYLSLFNQLVAPITPLDVSDAYSHIFVERLPFLHTYRLAEEENGLKFLCQGTMTSKPSNTIEI